MRNLHQQLCFSFLLVFFQSTAFADSERLQIEYPSAAWNTSSTEVDTAHLFIKKADGGRFVKILVTETEPDSSIFTGDFSVDFSTTDASPQGQLDVYIPPADARGKNESVQAFSKQVTEGKITASPILIKQNENGFKVDVYDTEQQLQQAQEIIRREKQAQELAEKAKEAQIAVETQNTQRNNTLSNRATEIAKAAVEASANEVQRLKQSQLEAQKRELQKQKMQELQEVQKERVRNEADFYAQKGREAFRANKFQLAEEYFRLATERNPEDDSFYFMYGAALYRNNKLPEAMVKLRLSEKDNKNMIERSYYMGLIHYQMKEYAPAADYFLYAKNAKKEGISAPASLYRGLSLMSLDRLEEAKSEFEWVIDNSKNNPELDEKAEEYLERVINLINYHKKISRKSHVELQMGAIYDSNVLLSSDISNSSSGTASDKGGLRLMFNGEAGHHLFVRDNYNLEANIESLYIYTLDDDLSAADPWQTTVSTIYTSNGTTEKNTAYSFVAKPYYQTLYMDPTETGTRSNILNSFGLSTEFTSVKRTDYFVKYAGYLQKDDSLLDSLTTVAEDDNLDGILFNISNTHTILLNPAKKKALISTIQAWINNAEGDNESYQKIGVSSTYVEPAKWKNSFWTLGLEAYKIRYQDSDDGRRDTNITFSGSLTKPINDSWSMIGVGSYASNTSTDEDNYYSKYSLMFLAQYSWQEN